MHCNCLPSCQITQSKTAKTKKTQLKTPTKKKRCFKCTIVKNTWIFSESALAHELKTKIVANEIGYCLKFMKIIFANFGSEFKIKWLKIKQTKIIKNIALNNNSTRCTNRTFHI